MGFELSDYEDEPPFEVWPDNWPAWRLFCQLSTQWQHRTVPHKSGIASSAPTGLHYPSLYPLLDRLCPDADDWQDTFARVRACEDGALAQMQANQ